MNTNQKFLSGIVIGVAVGAAILFLTKSEKGQQLLSDAKDAASDAADNAKDTWKDKFESLEKQVKYLAKKGKSFIDDLEDKAKDITGAIKGL